MRLNPRTLNRLTLGPLVATMPSQSFSSLLAGQASRQRNTQHLLSSNEFSTAAAPAKDEEKTEEEQTLGSIVGTYGAYPLVGLGSIALISKEIYFLGPEFLMGANFTLSMFVVYVMLSGNVNSVIDEWRAACKKTVVDIWGMEEEMLKVAIEKFEGRMHFPEFLENVKQHEVESMRAMYAAKALMAKHDAQSAVEAKLRGVIAKENDEELKANIEFTNNLIQHTKDSFIAAPDEDKQKFLNACIANMGGEVPSSENPLGRYITAFIDADEAQAQTL